MNEGTACRPLRRWVSGRNRCGERRGEAGKPERGTVVRKPLLLAADVLVGDSKVAQSLVDDVRNGCPPTDGASRRSASRSPAPGGTRFAAEASVPARRVDLGTDAHAPRTLASPLPPSAFRAQRALRRQDPRRQPRAEVLPARICAGGGLSASKGRPYRDPRPRAQADRLEAALPTRTVPAAPSPTIAISPE